MRSLFFLLAVVFTTATVNAESFAGRFMTDYQLRSFTGTVKDSERVLIQVRSNGAVKGVIEDYSGPLGALAVVAKFKGKIRNGKMNTKASNGEKFKLVFRNLTANTTYITGTVKGSGGSCGLRFSKF